VELVAATPAGEAEEDHHAEEHVTLIETSRSEEIAVVKSLLEGAGIPYLTEGEVLNELFPTDTMVTLFTRHAAVIFKVPASRAEEAHGLLEGKIDTSAEELSESEGEGT
jgi:hypothetical protein